MDALHGLVTECDRSFVYFLAALVVAKKEKNDEQQKRKKKATRSRQLACKKGKLGHVKRDHVFTLTVNKVGADRVRGLCLTMIA